MHVPNQFQRCLGMLPGTNGGGGTSRSGMSRIHPNGCARSRCRRGSHCIASWLGSLLLYVSHQGLPICHGLSYALTHEGYGLLLAILGMTTSVSSFYLFLCYPMSIVNRAGIHLILKYLTKGNPGDTISSYFCNILQKFYIEQVLNFVIYLRKTERCRWTI